MCLCEPEFPCNCAAIDAAMDATLPVWDGMIGAQIKTAPAVRQHCDSGASPTIEESTDGRV